MDGATVLSAAEVRQKPVTEEDAMQFAASVHEAGVATGYIAALSPSQSPLPRDELRERAEEAHGVLVAPIESVSELLVAALMWSGRPVPELLEEFPQTMVDRLEEIEASEPGVATWAALFAADE